MALREQTDPRLSSRRAAALGREETRAPGTFAAWKGAQSRLRPPPAGRGADLGGRETPRPEDDGGRSIAPRESSRAQPTAARPPTSVGKPGRRPRDAPFQNEVRSGPEPKPVPASRARQHAGTRNRSDPRQPGAPALAAAWGEAGARPALPGPRPLGSRSLGAARGPGRQRPRSQRRNAAQGEGAREIPMSALTCSLFPVEYRVRACAAVAEAASTAAVETCLLPLSSSEFWAHLMPKNCLPQPELRGRGLGREPAPKSLSQPNGGEALAFAVEKQIRSGT